MSKTIKIPPFDMETQCFKCKKKTKSSFATIKDTGSRAFLLGTCKVCHGNTSRTISRDNIEKFKSGKSGGCDCPYSGGADEETPGPMPAVGGDDEDFAKAGGVARRKKSRGSRKTHSRKSGSRKSGSRKSRKSKGSRKTGSRKSRKSTSRKSRKTHSRKSRHSRK